MQCNAGEVELHTQRKRCMRTQMWLAKTRHWQERAARRHDSDGPAANCGRRRSWTRSVSQAVALVPRRQAGSRKLLIHNLSILWCPLGTLSCATSF